MSGSEVSATSSSVAGSSAKAPLVVTHKLKRPCKSMVVHRLRFSEPDGFVLKYVMTAAFIIMPILPVLKSTVNAIFTVSDTSFSINISIDSWLQYT